jgi:hypothetical protein
MQRFSFQFSVFFLDCFRLRLRNDVAQNHTVQSIRMSRQQIVFSFFSGLLQASPSQRRHAFVLSTVFVLSCLHAFAPVSFLVPLCPTYTAMIFLFRIHIKKIALQKKIKKNNTPFQIYLYICSRFIDIKK